MNNKEYDKLWGRHSLHCQEIHDLFKTHEKLRKDHEDALAKIALSTRSFRGGHTNPGYYMADLGINRVALAGKTRINSCHLDNYRLFCTSSKSKALAGPKGKLP